jgi:Peptidase family S64
MSSKSNVFALSAGILVISMAWAPTIEALDCSQQETQARPISLGVSGGNINSFTGSECFGGTLGSMVQNRHSKQFILSNNHVLADINKAKPGQPIVQPGLLDVSCAQDPSTEVASFTRAIPISFGGAPNGVDAAIAAVKPGDVSSTILNIGGIASSVVEPRVGMGVQKMGRTSCYTTGTITAVNVNMLRITYGPGKVATFRNQVKIGTSGFSSAGDSGSLIVTQESCPRAVGLLFAGASDDSFTLANPISRVLKRLKVAMTGSCTAAATSDTAQPDDSVAYLGISTEDAAAAISIRDLHERDLMKIAGAVGTGIGIGDQPGQAVIEVYVDQLTPEAQAVTPAAVDGVPVKLIETGPVVAY